MQNRLKLSILEELVKTWRDKPYGDTPAYNLCNHAAAKCAEELEAALAATGPASPEPTCAGPHVDARDCPLHRKDVYGSASPELTCMEQQLYAGTSASPEPKALDLADEMDEYRDQMPGGPHDLLLRAAAALRAMATTEPTREPCDFCGGDPLSESQMTQHMIDVHNMPDPKSP